MVKTFKQFIREALTPKVYHNIRPRTLMNLSKEHGNTRFSIDFDDKLHAGKAYDFIHNDICDDSKIRGVITHNKETGEHLYDAQHEDWEGVDEDDNEGNWVSSEHPILKRLENLGAKRGSLSGDFEEATVKPIKESFINEGKVHALDNKWAGEFKVFQNPSKAQVKTLNDNLQGGGRGMIRSLKYNDDHYVWDAYHGEHQETAKKLGIHAKDRGLFFHRKVKDGDYDIPKLHKDFNCQCRTDEY